MTEQIKKVNCETKYRKYVSYLVVLIYFGVILFFETDYAERMILSIYDDTEFWDEFLVVIFYSVFAISFLCLYRRRIKECIQNIKQDTKMTYLKHIGVALAFIIITMVASAIILSCFGVGDSANDEAIADSISKNGLVTLLTVVLLGPFVEELVFRGEIYSLLRGEKGNTLRCIVANIVTSLIFAIYHCDVSFWLVFDVEQILSVIPLFFAGIGYSYVQEKSSNIICSVVTHIIMNLISLS